VSQAATTDPARTGRAARPELPPPLVRFFRHPIRWTRIKLELILDAVVLAHVGVFIIAALYYLITQTSPTVKHWWNTTVTPPSLRHDIRDVGEGVLASCMAQAIVWNHFTRSHLKAGHRFREWRDRYHVPVGLAAVVSAIVIGTVAYLAGDGVLHLLSVRAHNHTVAGSIWNRTATIWNSNWDKKALGFVAALAARRPLHVIYDEVQAYFAGRRADAGRPLRWYHPPVYKARYHYLLENQHEIRRYPILLKAVMGLALVACVGLAGFGYYVLTYKA
jgi:hypothetical protein